MTDPNTEAMELWRKAQTAYENAARDEYGYDQAVEWQIEAAAAIIAAKLKEYEARNDRLMIAAAATVKASMDEYKRGHADGERKGLAAGLEQAARIARAAQYSKTPAHALLAACLKARENGDG